MSDSVVQQVRDKLNIVDVVSSYLKLEKTGINFRAPCPFHSEKSPSFFVSPSRQSFKCFGCFPAKSLVKTERGYHNIEDLRKGQMVLTDKGRFMPIIRTLQRSYKGDVYDVRIRKSSEVTSLTGDHKVFVIKTKNCISKHRLTRLCQRRCQFKGCKNKFFQEYKIEKVPASSLSIGDYLLYPIDQEVKDMKKVNLDKFSTWKKGSTGFYPREFPLKVQLNEDFLKLAGYYIAEGSNHRAYIRFSLGDHELSFAKEIQALIKKVFQLKSAIHIRSGKKTGIEITACNSKLANIFGNLFGKGSDKKHIPFEFQTLNPVKQKVILEAILKGDGYIKRQKRKGDDSEDKIISTTSLVLMEQMRDILFRLKIAPSVIIEKEKVDKNNVHHKVSYRIKWQENCKIHFSDFHEDKRGVRYWISPIKEIKKRNFKGEVYNFTVAEDHSYLAKNFVVGNCGVSGSAFDFVMQIEGIEFGDALKILAKRAGVQLKEYNPELKTKRQRLYEICELSCKFFEKQLETETGKRVVAYLKKRGVREETIKKWRIGYSIDEWRKLSDFLVSRGYDRKEVVEAGLAIASDKDPYDRFRGRIIFPVFDLSSQIVGFGGRIFEKDDKTAKYLNIQNTLLYDKSKTLYGLNFAKMEIRKKDTCILQEGYMDVILSHQAGFENTVAASGTSLTPFQLEILKRYTKNLLFSFDMDLAGSLATKRGIELAQKDNFDIKVISMPQDKDPADVISENPKEWERLIAEAKEIMDFYFDDAFLKFEKDTPKGKKEISSVLLPFIKKIPNTILQFHFIKKLATGLRVSEEAVLGELKKITHQKEEVKEEAPVVVNKKKERGQLLQEKILSLILKSEEQLEYLLDEDIPLFSPKFQTILSCLKKENDIKKALQKLEKNDLQFKMIIDDCVFKSEIETETDIGDEFQICLSAFRDFSSKKILQNIEKEIKEAEIRGDEEKVKELMLSFNKLVKS